MRIDCAFGRNLFLVRNNKMGKYDRMTDEQLIRKLHEGEKEITDFINECKKNMK